MLTDYLKWLDQNNNAELLKVSENEVEAEDTEMALLCPQTGSIMTKYRIAADSDHRLDYSPRINAVWMDAGEWELIKQKGLAGQLNNVFTHHWQRELVAKESADIMAALYQRKFGDSYEQIREFRKLLDELPEKHEALAYLMSEDPYDP